MFWFYNISTSFSARDCFHREFKHFVFFFILSENRTNFAALHHIEFPFFLWIHSWYFIKIIGLFWWAAHTSLHFWSLSLSVETVTDFGGSAEHWHRLAMRGAIWSPVRSWNPAPQWFCGQPELRCIWDRFPHCNGYRSVFEEDLGHPKPSSESCEMGLVVTGFSWLSWTTEELMHFKLLNPNSLVPLLFLECVCLELTDLHCSAKHGFILMELERLCVLRWVLCGPGNGAGVGYYCDGAGTSLGTRNPPSPHLLNSYLLAQISSVFSKLPEITHHSFCTCFFLYYYTFLKHLCNHSRGAVTNFSDAVWLITCIRNEPPHPKPEAKFLCVRESVGVWGRTHPVGQSPVRVRFVRRSPASAPLRHRQRDFTHFICISSKTREEFWVPLATFAKSSSRDTFAFQRSESGSPSSFLLQRCFRAEEQSGGSLCSDAF